MEIAGFIPKDFKTWQGHTCVVVFTPGCNFQCPYCSHSVLVECPKTLERKNTDTILDEIHRLEDDLTAVVITGGEPTLQNDLPRFCRELRKTNLEIKLETNGTQPQVLRKLIDRKLVDYIAMDLKATSQNYGKVAKAKQHDLNAINDSKNLLLHSDVDYEFRTTFVPDLIEESDLRSIIWGIQYAKRYALQQFDPETCLDEDYEKKELISKEELDRIAFGLKQNFDGELIVRTKDNEEVIG